jgi:hypothetical protein
LILTSAAILLVKQGTFHSNSGCLSSNHPLGSNRVAK